MVAIMVMLVYLYRVLAANNPNKNYDYSRYEQDMNEAAQRVGSHNAQQPQHEQYDSNCVEHKFILCKYVPIIAQLPGAPGRNRTCITSSASLRPIH
jgi:hypothetical protein